MNALIMPSPNKDQVQYLRAQLVHKDTQLEQVRSERDTHFVQEEELLAHMRLHSSEVKDWKSRAVAKRNKYYVNPQKQLIEPRERKKPWANNFNPDGHKQKQNSGMCVSLTVTTKPPANVSCENCAGFEK